MTDTRRAADDEVVFSLLDSYVEGLHAGARPDRELILVKDPTLAAALDCLDALELFVPLSSPAEHAPPGSNADTLDAAAFGSRTPGSSPIHASALGVGLGEFGDYELLAEIGRGGMGVVYRARQKSLERIVAVKMILASHLASAEQVRRFQVEARAAAGVNHAHVTRVFEVGQIHGQHYFTMEHVDGVSLAARIAQGRLDHQAAVRLLVEVARAVEHLHRHGIVHRDLKPSNILLDNEGRSYVTDFGLAKMFVSQSQETATGMIAGTPSYMAPEQAAGKNASVGPLSDVYSLGAVLYELLAGRPPFRGENPLDTLLDVLEREPPAPRSLDPRIPRALELIVLKCLEKNPAGRYPSAAALADDLERFLSGEPLLAQPPSRLLRLWRWAQRKPALSMRLGAFTLFYAVEAANYHLLHGVEWDFHVYVTWIMVIWIAGSIFCQGLLARPRWEDFARYAWAALDAALLTTMLRASGGVASSITIAYPLLIVLSALWLQLRLVWFMTALCVAGYLGLLAGSYFFPIQMQAAVDLSVARPDLQAAFETPPTRHIYFVAALFVLGAAMSYLVARMRTLSQYYERWRA